MRLRALVLLLLGFSAPVSAEWLVGAGYVNGVIGANLEWAGERSSFYVLPGAHVASRGWDITDEFRWVAGMRRRIEGGHTADSGFFVGLLGGDLDGRHQRERLGLGGELGYQWVTEHTRWTLSSGMAVLEEVEERDEDVEPRLTIGVSASFRR